MGRIFCPVSLIFDKKGYADEQNLVCQSLSVQQNLSTIEHVQTFSLFLHYLVFVLFTVERRRVQMEEKWADTRSGNSQRSQGILNMERTLVELGSQIGRGVRSSF